MAEEKNSRIFMKPGVAEISDGYADNVKYCRELRICLLSTIGIIVKQPFFRELIEYFDKIQIQGNIGSLGLDKEKLGIL